MYKLFTKYINACRSSKLNGLLFSIIFGVLCFTTDYIYNVEFDKLTNMDSLIIAIGVGICMAFIWFILSYSVVRTMDRRDKRKSEEHEKELEARRQRAMAKASGKVNNKKKKKNRNIEVKE